MGLPISFCQEGFLGHNYLLRPTLYISGDKMCQTQGVSSVWINFPWRSLLQDLEGRSSCTLASAEERLLPLSHLLTPTCTGTGTGTPPPPPGRSDARVWPGISSTLSSLQLAPHPLSLTPERPSSTGWGRPVATLLLHPGLSGWLQPGWGCPGSLFQISFIQDKTDQISQIWLYGPDLTRGV